MSRRFAQAADVHFPSGTTPLTEAGSQDSIRVPQVEEANIRQRSVMPLPPVEQSVILSQAESEKVVRTDPSIKEVETACMTLGTSSTVLPRVLEPTPTIAFKQLPLTFSKRPSPSPKLAVARKETVTLPPITSLMAGKYRPFTSVVTRAAVDMPPTLASTLHVAQLQKLNTRWTFPSPPQNPPTSTQLQLLTLGGCRTMCRVHCVDVITKDNWQVKLGFRPFAQGDRFSLKHEGSLLSNDCIYCFSRIVGSIPCIVKMSGGASDFCYNPVLVGGGGTRRANQKANKNRNTEKAKLLAADQKNQQDRQDDFVPQHKTFAGKKYKHVSTTVTQNPTKRARVDADLAKAVADSEVPSSSTSSSIGPSGETSSNYVPAAQAVAAKPSNHRRSSSLGSSSLASLAVTSVPSGQVSTASAQVAVASSTTAVVTQTTPLPVLSSAVTPVSTSVPVPAPTVSQQPAVPPVRHFIHQWKCECEKSCYKRKCFELETKIPILDQNGDEIISAANVGRVFVLSQKERRTNPRPMAFPHWVKDIRGAVSCVPEYPNETPLTPGEDVMWTCAWKDPLGRPMVAHRKSQSYFRNLCDSLLGSGVTGSNASCNLCASPLKASVLRQVAQEVLDYAPIRSFGMSPLTWYVPPSVPTTSIPDVAYCTTPVVAIGGAVLAPAGALVTYLARAGCGRIDTSVNQDPLVGYVSPWVHVAEAKLKFVAFKGPLLAATTQSVFSKIAQLVNKPPPAPPIQSTNGFILKLNSAGIPIITKQNRLPPVPPPVRPAPGSIGVGTKYKFNEQMKKKHARHLFNSELNIRQKLLASGALGQIQPSFLGLKPGPVAKDPLVAVEVECVSAPVIDHTFNGMGHDDLRTDQSRNATLLHEESMLQWWEYRTYYLGRPLSVARFLADSNAITAVANSKSQRTNMSPETRVTLLCEEAHRAIQNSNVPRSLGQNVLTPIQTVSLVLQVKDMDLAETQRRLGVGGAFRLFH